MQNICEEVNIFNCYSQKENQFTNGLISVLRLGNIQDRNFVNDFLNKLIDLKTPDEYKYFQVLKGYEDKSTADAALIGNIHHIIFETKIISASLREEQIINHLKAFANVNQKIRKLILLTPDDSKSSFIDKFLHINNIIIIHLEWKAVYDYLEHYISGIDETGVFASIVEQYLDIIRDLIFKEDIVGIIHKVAFGNKSGVYANGYLEQMRRGEWTEWRTPREYKNLVGTSRKLLLYDKILKAITVEVEIEKVLENKAEPRFPWSNRFAEGTLKIIEPPIKIDIIQQIAGFKDFSKNRSPYRNLTHEQYKQLNELSKK